MKKHTLFVVVVLIAFIMNAQDKEYQMAKGIKSHQDLFNTSMNDEVSCYRIPALITAPNGDLIAAIDERLPSCADLRGSDDINIVIRRSSNNGKTWGPIKTVMNFPLGQSASDPSLIVDDITKEIFLFYNFMNLTTEKDVYYLHVMKSSDNGKTWSKPEDITSQIAKPEWHKDFKFITSGRGIQTSKGTLLHCMVNLNSGMHIFGSKDHGRTWFFIDTPIKPADESKIIELADGSWMVNARENKAGVRYVHTSSDEGKTWETKAAPELIDSGCNASIIRYTAIKDGYKKNRLLFSNAKTKKGRTNLTVRVSYDEGKTWTEGKTVYEGPSAYSSLSILKNGDIGVFFEKDEYTKNEFARFSLKWLTDKKDKYKKPRKKR